VARHQLGVPLHPRAHATAVSGRLSDGSWVSVVERSDDGRWLKVVSNAGLEGWITKRYTVDAAATISPTPKPLVTDSIWGSLAGCQSQLAGLVAKRQPGKARLMSFNLRWFPDGAPGKKAGSRPTDIEWLACALAASNVDVVLLQEIKATVRAQAELANLIEKLDRLSGGRHRLELDACPIATGQHVGILYDSERVTATNFRDYASLNPHGTACQDQLRPGVGGYFKFIGGLDMHLISVHLKSGTKRRDHELRLRSVAGLTRALAEAKRAQPDSDLIVAGDLNTMGCRHCSPALSAEQELDIIRDLLAATTPPLALLPTRPGCSQYYRGQAQLLDHFLVTLSSVSGRPTPTTQASGFCGELSCQPFPGQERPLAYQHLSDHCPMVLELTDTDLD
jgi:endonuclease/exonuclease/phosphatase family metal-dependent hydrolase